jgi:hypothetical protein
MMTSLQTGRFYGQQERLHVFLRTKPIQEKRQNLLRQFSVLSAGAAVVRCTSDNHTGCPIGSIPDELVSPA